MTADGAPNSVDQKSSLATGVVVRCAIFALIILTLGIPVTELWRFLLLVVAVMALCFGSIHSELRRWLIALAAVAVVCALSSALPGPRIEEGDNVYIPVGTALDVYEAKLPPDAQRLMKQIFDDSYINNSKGLPGSPDWLQAEPFKQHPSPFLDQAFSASSDALLQRPKYSRRVDGVDFNTQDEARIGAIDRRVYNFYRPSTKKAIKRSLASPTPRGSTVTRCLSL